MPLAAVQLMSDELFVPVHQGIGRGESGQRFEAFAANRKGEDPETTAFGIGEANVSATEFGMESAVFFQEIGNDLLLVAINPTGDHGDKDLQNHGDSWGWEYRCVHLIEYTENPRDLNTERDLLPMVSGWQMP
jgi:hypothetical protein